jgi:protease I
MKKILIITGDGGESFETLFAYHRFLEAGYEPVIASTSRKRMHLVIHDFEEGWDTYIERTGYQVESQIALNEVNVNEYDAVLIPGGRAPEYLRHNPQVTAIVSDFARQGKWIWAICHGVQVLITAGVLKPGMRVTAYEHCRSECESTGATYVSELQAVREGKIVTGQTWQSHPEFYREVFACLGEASAATGG